MECLVPLSKVYTGYSTFKSITVQAVDLGMVPYQLANLHIASVLLNDTETLQVWLGLYPAPVGGMWQKNIFVCGLIYPASLLSILVSGNEFEAKIRDNFRLVASHNT